MAQESDWYNRVAKVRIQVVKTWSLRPSRTVPTAIPFSKRMHWRSSLSLQRQGTSQELQAEYLMKLSNRSFAFLPRATEELTLGAVEKMDPGEVQQRQEVEEMEREATKKAESRRKQQAWNVDRTSMLGSDLRETRRSLRESLQPVFYVAASSKKNIQTLHLLECCRLRALITRRSLRGREFHQQALFSHLQVVRSRRGGAGAREPLFRHCYVVVHGRSGVKHRERRLRNTKTSKGS